MTPSGTALLDPPTPARSGSGGGASDGGRGRDDHGRGDGGANGPDEGALPVSNERLLMIFVLIASTMLFMGMIGAFIVLKVSSEVWPAPGSAPLPLGLKVNTGVIVASSLALALGHRAQRRGRTSAMRGWLTITVAGALVFLVLQAECWRTFLLEGFTAAKNTYGASFWLLTTTHFGHAVIGLLLLLRLLLKSLLAPAPARLRLSFDLAAMFWHFVDLAWIVVFLALA